jgi:hypothetical protein
LFWEKSTAGWLLMAGLFWQKSTAGWWLISQTNRADKKDTALRRSWSPMLSMTNPMACFRSASTVMRSRGARRVVWRRSPLCRQLAREPWRAWGRRSFHGTSPLRQWSTRCASRLWFKLAAVTDPTNHGCLLPALRAMPRPAPMQWRSLAGPHPDAREATEATSRRRSSPLAWPADAAPELVQITTSEQNTKHAQDTSTVCGHSREPAAMAAPRHEAAAQPLDHGRGPCSCWPTTLQLLLPSRWVWPCSISCSTTCVYQSAAAQKYARRLHHADYMWCLALAFEALKVMNGVFWLLVLDQRFSAKCLPHPLLTIS